MERNINVWLPLEHPPTGDVAPNPGMCPDWESNQRPFGSQARTQSTEPHQQLSFLKKSSDPTLLSNHNPNALFFIANFSK